MQRPSALTEGLVMQPSACPFCGCEMTIRSNRDWHHLEGDHDEACPFDGRPESTMTVPATDEQLRIMIADWNRRHNSEGSPANDGGALCGGRQCLRDRKEENPPGSGWPTELTIMILCPICGNKRCPHATDHRHACTGSNEPGQAGSAYECCKPHDAELKARAL